METIRLYLQDIDIDSEEIEYIKNASIQLIGNEAIEADQPIARIEDHPINATTDDEETLPMPDMPLVQDMILVVDQGLIISNKDEQSTNMMETIEYHTIKVPIHDEQPQPNMIQIIYPDVPSLNVDPPSMVSIPIDQGLINKDEQSTNMMKTIEYHPINVTTDDEDMLPPMPDMPLVQVDPSSVVPIPVDQGFLSRYSPNEVVLAKRFKSYFWPAKIIEVYSDKIYVTFFPLSEEMEKEEVSSEEDVRAFTDEEIEAASASLCLGLSQVAFKNAVKFASAELN
uniref:PWWP domain-containing protein n=1 Tax=Trichogramma kaykai TaxID=54128 RepID=A0ABD2XQ59_9HYME